MNLTDRTIKLMLACVDTKHHEEILEAARAECEHVGDYSTCAQRCAIRDYIFYSDHICYSDDFESIEY